MEDEPKPSEEDVLVALARCDTVEQQLDYIIAIIRGPNFKQVMTYPAVRRWVTANVEEIIRILDERHK